MSRLPNQIPTRSIVQKFPPVVLCKHWLVEKSLPSSTIFMGLWQHGQTNLADGCEDVVGREI